MITPLYQNADTTSTHFINYASIILHPLCRPCALFKYVLLPNLFFSGDFRASAIMEISIGPQPETLVCSDAVEFVMKLCNFVLCVVTHQKKAVLCCTGVEAGKLMQIQSIACCIYNESSDAAREDVGLRTRLNRDSHRRHLTFCCWKEGRFVPMECLEEQSGRKKRKVSSPSFLCFPSIIGMDTSATSKLPTICINFQRNSRRAQNGDLCERSFLFIGCLINGLLTVSFVYGLDLDAGAVQSCNSFFAEDDTGRICDHEEFYVAGFFLHNDDYSHKIFEELKQCFCKIAPVFVHLSQTRANRNSAEWWFCSQNSCAIRFTTQAPGWLVHDVKSDASSRQVSTGFDVIFRPGKHSVSVVDPERDVEKRISQFSGKIQDAHARPGVPFCHAILKDLVVRERLQCFRHFTHRDASLRSTYVWWVWTSGRCP